MSWTLSASIIQPHHRCPKYKVLLTMTNMLNALRFYQPQQQTFNNQEVQTNRLSPLLASTSVGAQHRPQTVSPPGVHLQRWINDQTNCPLHPLSILISLLHINETTRTRQMDKTTFQLPVWEYVLKCVTVQELVWLIPFYTIMCCYNNHCTRQRVLLTRYYH